MYSATQALLEGARDYRWLLDQGYSDDAALKLVGDRLRLSREERLILFRGVAASAPSRRRRELLAASVRGRELLIDGHNQAFTVMHYLNGRPLFLGSDGLLRDAGASHGHIVDRELFRRALSLLGGAVAEARPAAVLAYFDAPITGSIGHAALFREDLAARGVEAVCAVEPSADGPLKKAGAGAAVATGDSAIVEALARRYGGGPQAGGVAVFDAARFAIELAFGPAPSDHSWLDLAAELDGDPGRLAGR